MGASQHKKQRITERESGLTAKERAQQEALQKKKRDRNLYILVGVLVVLFIAAVIFVNSSLFTRGLAAVKVNDASYSVANVRYAYQTAYSQFYDANSDYISEYLDPNADLSDQMCTLDGYEDKTWEEYFQDLAVESLRQTTALCEEARAAGYTLSEEDRSGIENNLSMVSLYAQLYGYSADGYIALFYGDGNNESTVREMMELGYLSSAYARDRQDSYSYTDEELDAYYDGVADSYNSFTYAYAFLAAADDAAMADAREDAAAIMDLSGDSVEAFEKAVIQLTENEANVYTSLWTNVADLKDWFTDPARIPGDVTSVETSSGIRLYCFESIETNDYPTVDVRHILVTVTDEDGDGVYSDAEKETALNALKDIQAEWDGTEEGFIALAEEHSEDSGSNTNGGLYENVFKGEMVEEFDAFCFAGHQPGDTDIVYGENSNYAGYHLVYFVGEGELYSRFIADTLKSGEDYQAWLDALLENYTARRTFMFRYV